MSGILRLVLFGALIVGAVVPLVALLLASVGRGWFFPALLPPELTPESWYAFADPRAGLRGAAATAVGIATLTGIVAAAAGFAVARTIGRESGWPRTVAGLAAFMPIAAPPVALATGSHFILLKLGLTGTWAGVWLAHAVPATAYATLYLLGTLSAYEWRLEDEARTLGASSRQVMTLVAVPTLRRPIAEAFALGFLVSWSQVPLTLIIGGGYVRTLAVEVLAFAQSGQDRFAAAGGLLLTAPAVVLLAMLAIAVGRAEAPVP